MSALAAKALLSETTTSQCSSCAPANAANCDGGEWTRGRCLVHIERTTGRRAGRERPAHGAEARYALRRHLDITWGDVMGIQRRCEAQTSGPVARPGPNFRPGRPFCGAQANDAELMSAQGRRSQCITCWLSGFVRCLKDAGRARCQAHQIPCDAGVEHLGLIFG